MMKPDGRDVLYIVGLALVVGGALAYDWRAALLAAGVVFLMTALAAARRT